MFKQKINTSQLSDKRKPLKAQKLKKYFEVLQYFNWKRFFLKMLDNMSSVIPICFNNSRHTPSKQRNGYSLLSSGGSIQQNRFYNL